MKARIMKWGNSLAVRIPSSIAKEAGVEYGSSVDVEVEEGRMIVRSTPTHPNLGSLLRRVKKTNVHGEVSTGRRKGREVW